MPSPGKVIKMLLMLIQLQPLLAITLIRRQVTFHNFGIYFIQKLEYIYLHYLHVVLRIVETRFYNIGVIAQFIEFN